MMSGIRSKNTRPELFLGKRLYASGYRYRLHVEGMPGKPDLVFPKYGALIEVYGCFWHGHECRYFKLPSTNPGFWKQKIDGNRTRDCKNLGLLLDAGWRCLVVWECAIRKSQRSTDEIDVVKLAAQWLSYGGQYAIIDEQGLYNLKG